MLENETELLLAAKHTEGHELELIVGRLSLTIHQVAEAASALVDSLLGRDAKTAAECGGG